MYELALACKLSERLREKSPHPLTLRADLAESRGCEKLTGTNASTGRLMIVALWRRYQLGLLHRLALIHSDSCRLDWIRCESLAKKPSDALDRSPVEPTIAQ